MNNNFSNLIVGENVHIDPHVILDLWDKIIFKNHSGAGMCSKIFTHNNYVGTYSMLFPTKISPVVFEEHSGINPKGIYWATFDDVQGLLAQDRTVSETIEIARDVAWRLFEEKMERDDRISLPEVADKFDFPLVVGA